MIGEFDKRRKPSESNEYKKQTVMLIFLLLLFSACMFPVGLLYDPMISPKWYAAIIVSMIGGIWWMWGRKKHDDHAADRSLVLSAAAVLVLAYNIMAVLIMNGPWRVDGTSALRPVTGVFDNSSAYALNMCLLIAMAATGWDRMGTRMKWVGLTIMGLAALSVILAQSRCGIICIGLISIQLGCRGLNCRKTVFRGMASMVIAAAIILVTGTKHDSTSGRTFIIGRTMELIRKKPISGYGTDGFERNYMICQAEYFKNNNDREHAWLADDIRHPLNEFLYVWVCWGIGGLIALTVILGFPIVMYFRNRSIIPEYTIPPILTVITFALFSYPGKYPMTYFAVALPYVCLVRNIFGGTCLRKWREKTACTIMALAVVAMTIGRMTDEISWCRLKRISDHSGSKAVVEEFTRLYENHGTDQYFLFSYMVTLYKAGRCEEAIGIYEKLKEYCWSYQMELIAGDACRQVQRYDEALEHYETAGNMCPVRFAPLSGMLETYIADNRYGKADSVARRILNKRVKVESYKVCIVKNKAKKWLKSRS